MIDPETGEVFTPFLRTAFNYDMAAASLESGLSCEDDSLAIQSERDSCDINVIVERFLKTGQMPDNVRVPQSGDFTSVTDYQSALNAVIEADDAFMELPPAVRARFENDPQKLMDFMADANNREAAIELGLVQAPKGPPEPLSVRVVPDSTPAPVSGA